MLVLEKVVLKTDLKRDGAFCSRNKEFVFN